MIDQRFNYADSIVKEMVDFVVKKSKKASNTSLFLLKKNPKGNKFNKERKRDDCDSNDDESNQEFSIDNNLYSGSTLFNLEHVITLQIIIRSLI